MLTQNGYQRLLFIMLRRPMPSARGGRGRGSWKQEWQRAPPHLRVAVVGLAASTGLYVASKVETMPLTGRRRVMFLSREAEERLGDRACMDIMQRERVLPATHPMTRAVRRVGRKIVEQAEAESVSVKPMVWQFYVLDATEPNAFCLPGGKVFVNAGLFQVLSGEDALAAVLFHEAAHGIARHGAEKVSFSLLVYGLLALVVPDYGYLSDLLVKVAADLPYSRKLELEADSIGLRLMARACYDPRAAIQMNAALGKLEAKHGGNAGALKYFSTHPPSDERVRALRRGLRDALDMYESSGCSDTKRAFGRAIQPAAAAGLVLSDDDVREPW